MNPIIETKGELMNLLCLYLPTKHPYTSAKWYCDIFDLDPRPLDKGSDVDCIVLDIPEANLSIYFIQSQEELQHHFKARGSDSILSTLMLKVTDIQRVYNHMKRLGTEILSDGIEISDCGDMLRFQRHR